MGAGLRFLASFVMDACSFFTVRRWSAGVCGGFSSHSRMKSFSFAVGFFPPMDC